MASFLFSTSPKIVIFASNENHLVFSPFGDEFLATRLASTQGEIRVGSSHQARLPEYQPTVPVELDAECCKEREDLRWVPGMALDGDLLMYLRAARSMAAFAGMCDGGSPDDGCIAASRDDTTINALDILHDSGYDPGKALQALVKCPVPKGIEKKWSEEETKRFVKGLRQFGKNFFRIRKDLLPHKDTSELVEFYYLWKKTPGANYNRTHRRNRRQGSLRRIRNTRNSRAPKEDSSVGSSRPISKEQGEASSVSEDENSEDDSDSRDNVTYQCQNCFTTNSRDWQHAGKEKTLLCTDCRSHYKKYGELPARDVRESPYLFRPVQVEEDGRIRTRTRTKELVNSDNSRRPKRGSGTDTPESEADKKSGTKSPGALSNCSSPSDKNKKKSKSETSKGRKRIHNEQADVENEDDKDSLFKRKRHDRAESPSESITTDSGSVDEENNEVDNEPEGEVGQDGEAVSSRSTSPVSNLPSTEEKELPEKLIPEETNEKEESEKEEETEVKEPVIKEELESSDEVKGEIPPPILSEISLQTSIKIEPGLETESVPLVPPPSATPEGMLCSPVPPVSSESNQQEGSDEMPEEKDVKPVIQQPLPQNLNFIPSSPYCAGTVPIPSTASIASSINSTTNASSMMQSEPQNLKIKQEILTPSEMATDPLQSLKEVKVPGYPSCGVSQPLQSNTENTFLGPIIENIKKEPEYNLSKSPKMMENVSSPRLSSPRLTPSPAVSSHNSVVVASSGSQVSIPQPVIQASRPPGQPSPLPSTSHASPYISHSSLVHQSTHAHAHAHALSYATHAPHPYSSYTYPYSFPYPYPPRMQPIPPSTTSESTTSLLSSQTTRVISVRETEETLQQESHQHSMHQTASQSQASSSFLTSSHSVTLSHSSSTIHKMKPRVSSPSTHIPCTSAPVTVAPPTHPALAHQPERLSPAQSLGPMMPISLSRNHVQPSSHMKPTPPSSAAPAPHGSIVGPQQLVPSNQPPSGIGMPSTPPSMDPLRPSHAMQPLPQSPSSPRPLQPSMQQHPVGAPMPARHPALSGLQPMVLPEEIKTEVISEPETPQQPMQQEEDEVPSPTHIPRGPSPEPKIEDTECHRSQSAIFLRHWNRGDFNSCTRTDLTFKPVPDSKLARKREERLRKQAEKEREEREKAAAQARKVATPEKQDAPKAPSGGPIETITSPYDRFTPRQGYPDTPALRQLSEYARPHAGFSPGTLPRSGLALPPQCIDPLLHFQFNSMYGPGARERLELEHLEREKRERELRELREREFKEELMKNAGAGPRVPNPLDPHWLEMHRRYASLAPGGPPQGAALHQFGLYPAGQTALSQLERERLERLGIPTSIGPPLHPGDALGSSVERLSAERLHAERMALATDPMVRLQMAGISPEYHAHTHAHTHAHSHTHLHLHPGQEIAAASSGFPLPASAGAYPRPGMLQARDPTLGLHHPTDLLGRPYADQLAHQLSAQAAAHEQLQRQMLLERERFPHPSAQLHPTIVAQHEEYLRQQQREREMKVRALEEAAREFRP